MDSFICNILWLVHYHPERFGLKPLKDFKVNIYKFVFTIMNYRLIITLEVA